MSKRKRKKPGKYHEFRSECAGLSHIIVLPRLTKAQNSIRQTEIVKHRNPDNWNMREALAALPTEKRSENAKKQWKYNTKYVELMHTDGKGVRGDIPREVRASWGRRGDHSKSVPPEESRRRHFLGHEVARLSRKYGLDPPQYIYLSLKELEEIYADLIQW